ncbi:GspE/PulE family protein [Desulfotruncus alcoholivorax]|uniref:GspE/PulE family protein n=1 Tax=Desulfotruncus alcoholivorax TaxID=265477 RepID=UPI00042289C2|nr:GspE/PulE family protein [Desulfotruncus alcoholivorax]
MDIPSSKKILGYQLIEKGIITKEQLWEAIRVQTKTGEKLGRILIKLGFASEADIEQLAGDRKESLKNIEQVAKDDQDYSTQDYEAMSLKEETMASDAPVIRLVNSIFIQAIEEKASDIHFEPNARGIRVRFRIDGMLRQKMQLPRKDMGAVISRIKIMSAMDIAEKRLPQDGRIQLILERREIDLRVSTLPTVYGEKVVARLLDRSDITAYTLKQIGFSEKNLNLFKKLLCNSHGMVLLTGPTGSGKTTTMYAALNQLNDLEKNIVTVEDPVEYLLEGINQTQVNYKAGMTFAAGLRSILRQDPDIIMVGEIRDKETARIAIRAANTGHLVLSTMHTNDAIGAITCLLDMGAESFLVAASVLGVVAQRLVRVICLHCKEDYYLETDAPERRFINVSQTEVVKLYRGKGCDKCGYTGYSGRLPIHEVLVVNSGLRQLIVKNAAADELREKAVGCGLVSLKQDGIEKALQGLTTLQEVMRVTYSED